MLGSPGGRRRRLIQAIVPSNNNETTTSYYTSVPTSASSSSSPSSPGFSIRRRGRNNSNDPRKQPQQQHSKSNTNFVTMGFRPVDPAAVAGQHHGYRIDVSRDGSMITAVPVDDLPLHGAGDGVGGGASRFKAPPPRPSPLMFGQELSSTSSLHGGSTHGLLDARGKQRTKMKQLVRPIIRQNSSFTEPSKIHTDTDSFSNNYPNPTARDKLKQAKGFLAFTKAGTRNNNRQQQQQQSPQNRSGSDSASSPRKTKVRWDLSPKRHDRVPQSQTLQPQISRSSSSGNLDDASFGSFPILSPNHKFDDGSLQREDVANTSRGEGSDIKCNTINDNEHDTNTVTVGTPSNEALLQQRMAEIQLQQKELAQNITKKGLIKGTLITAIDENLRRNTERMRVLDDELREIQLQMNSELQQQQQLHPTLPILSQFSVDEESANPIRRIQRNPSGVYDEVDDPSITPDTESVADLYRKEKSGRVMVTGLDPPSRPSPPPLLTTTIEEEMKQQHQYYRREAKEPDGPRISAILHANESNGEGNDDVTGGGITFDVRNDSVLMHMPANARRKTSSTKSRNNDVPFSGRPPLHHTQFPQMRQQQLNGLKNNQSRGKFVQFNLQNEITDMEELKFASTNSYDSPSADFEERAGKKLRDIKDDVSWEGEHFDVDAFNADTGSFLSSEHHHYVRERYHHTLQQQRQHGELERTATTLVETHTDLGFVQAVAAVVIQTAVRRFLAEIAAEERRYAVNVIQTALCNWMANQLDPYYISSASVSNQIGPPRRTTTKRVMFEDDYNDFCHFAATEIQRCYRGWWARDGVEVDHFAATTIQRMFRGWWVREGLDVDRYCAVEIQRIVRGYLCRMRYIYDRYCIIVAQSVVRRYLAFYTSAVRLANILYIQAIYRGYLVRAELRRYVRSGQEVAATFIQSQWRCYDAQMNYINALADILIVQSVIRRWLTIRKTRPKIALKSRSNQNPGVVVSPTNSARRDTHMVWKEHRLKIVNKHSSPKSDEYVHPDSLDEFHEDNIGGNEWYDGNKSETSDMLRSWKGRKSK